MSLSEIFDKYGSDKNISGYSTLYERLFDSIKMNVTTILEIGIGSVDPDMPSSFCGIYYHFPHYLPGASLRSWKEFFPNAHVYGMDIDPKCELTEDRINTFIGSSLDRESCDFLLKDLMFDFILDDGLHTGVGQLTTFRNLFDRVKTDGLYIVEDCGGTPVANLFTEYFEEFKKIADDHEYFLRGNVAFVRKNYSKRGSINEFDEFINNHNVKTVELPDVVLPIDTKSDYEEIFSRIYNEYGFFGSQESRSGDGSTIKSTVWIREKIKDLVTQKGIKTVVDIPCGDFNWMKEIVFNFEHYIGGDIVEKCIEDNKEKYESKRIEFIHFDLVKDKIPSGDLLIVRDVIGHFPLEDGKKIVDNILSSDCKYLLATSWYDPSDPTFNKTHINEDVPYGRFYFLNLTSSPFNLPDPEFYIDEGVFYDGDGKRKGLGLWDLEKVKQSYLRTIVEPEKTDLVDMNVLDIDIVTPTFHHIGQNRTDTQVIQIGAMDGISYDDTRAFLDLYRWNALLVEPIPEMFEELKENFKDSTNYIFEQSAITSYDGDVTMLTIPLSSIVGQNLHPGYKGMSAIYPLKNGFNSGYQRDIDVKSDYGIDIIVPSLTFNSLCEKHGIKKFDILICDAEGHDWIICDQIDFNKFRPSFMRFEYFNLTDEEKFLIVKKLKENGYVVSIVNGQDVDAVDIALWTEMGMVNNEITVPKKKTISIDENFNIYDYLKKLSKEEKEDLIDFMNRPPEIEVLNKDLTIVTGLWNINRTGRDFSHYIEHFKNFLDIPNNMFIYLPKEYEYLVWEKRSRENTFVKICELDDLKTLYEPFWDKTQQIRTDPSWYNSTGENGWLKNSPQATLEWYNPIVQSKMFLLNDATIWNPFDNEYFIWLDAGITNTVYKNYLIEERALDKIIPYLSNFLFLSYPYDANDEIHGFNFRSMNKFANDEVKCVCRGGLFGGNKETINQANSTYYSTLSTTLNNGFMGTEESIFSIMSYREPNMYRRYELDGNGMIVKFIESLITNNVIFAPIDNKRSSKSVTNYDLSKLKTNLYILTFNFPQQVQHTINSMEKTPEWLSKPNLFLLDNSTNEDAKQGNREIAQKYNFEYIDLGGNTGICGGRQAAAEHFDKSDADFMFFFEDDMTSNPPELEGYFCRNGFRKYIPNLYELSHKIMLKENFDFLKLTFTEVFFDNDKQCSWYNVPQEIRTKYWPDYDKLPVSGLDPNVPLTNFKNIRVTDGLAYIDGEIYYANWPMIVSKEGNRKMFIDTKWSHPYEQTWMSHMYQLTKEEKLRPAVLLASPIWHDRIKYYQNNERREN
jgi:FkbM family methyltransferase